MSPGNSKSSCNEQLNTALNLIKTKANRENMSRYHQDLVKWARNVDKRYAWVVLAALWTMMAATLGPYRMYGLVYAKVTQAGVYTREEASWPVSMIFTVENIIGPLVSIIVYHISYRSSMLLGGILLVAGNCMAYFSDSLLLDVLAIGFIEGIGFAFIFMPFMEIINNYFMRYRNAALGFALCGGTMSIFIWSPIFQWLLENYEWRTAYLGFGAVCSLNVLVVPLLKPNPRPATPVDGDGSNATPAGSATGNSNKFSKMSIRALSYQNSMRRQSTIMISRKAGAGVHRNDSIISVNPFASTAGIERKISRVISSSVHQRPAESLQKQVVVSSAAKQQQEQQQQQQQQQENQIEAYETVTLGEVGKGVESEFDMLVIVRILKIPGFHLIWYLELIYFWVFSIYCLVLVDYGTDRGCTREEAEGLLSFQSIGEIIGRMLLTIVVDMRFLSNRNTVVLVLVILTGLLVANTQVFGLFWIATMTTAISALASLLYILLNGLLVDFLGERQVTIGYGMASSVVGVLIIFRPQAVGFFRDTMGSYDPLMLSLAVSCALGAVLCLLEPLVTRLCCKREPEQQQVV